MGGSILLPAAAALFVGSHFLLSHPLRAPLVARLGERAFLGVYSVVALATMIAMVQAYRAAPATAPLWTVGDALWAVASAAMLAASVLFVGSLQRNPALPGAAAGAASAQARGVYAVTRHPMMWGFALWGISHVLVYPVAANLWLSGAIVTLALAGSALQDRRKAAADPAGWDAWRARTGFVPFAAIVQGRARIGGFGVVALAGGALLWLAATWAHIPLAGWRAGVWRWIG